MCGAIHLLSNTSSCCRATLNTGTTYFRHVLTFICLRRTLLRTTLSLSVPTDCDVMTRFIVARYVNLEQRYVSTCVGAGSGGGGEKRE
jgi:hypothetical protein